MSSFEAAANRASGFLARLPIVTRAIVAICVVLFFVSSVFPIIPLFSLDPSRLSIFELHRLNTYPLIHLDLLQILLDLIALTPMLGNLEKERGTLYTLLQILGPFSTFPAFLYLFIQHFIFGGVTPVVGSSVWVFLLAANEAVKVWKVHPFYSIAGYKVPSWSTPLLFLVLVTILFRSASLLGHMCALAVGYAYGLGYLKLFEPSEKILKIVESKLNFILYRVPYYISLEKREFENNEDTNSFLPTTTFSGSGESPVGADSSFIGQGRSLVA